MFTRKARQARRLARQGTNMIDPYYQGDAARHAGKALNANPYTTETEAHADWAQGWNEAKVEMTVYDALKYAHSS